jgi:hypothetical protein
MKVKWSGILTVALVVVAIIAYKARTRSARATEENARPSVVLIADLSEADSADACAEIIHSVRAAHERGVQVLELSPDSKSEMLRRYHVLTAPTVLVLDDSGAVLKRFEGEDRQTVEAVRTQLAQMHRR